MPNDTELCYLSISELENAYAEGLLSPISVVESYLRRIEALDGQLRSYTTVVADLALEAAHQSAERFSKGEPRSPLDGIPFGLKDVIDTAGIRTTANSPLFAQRVPENDATVVQRLDDAGAILLGKHAMYELHLGVPQTGGAFPAARNPWNQERIPGGSSSGSAVSVASGLCTGAIGTDTGGSIRGPAAYCGVVGFKPTAGLVSRYGVIPLAWTLDQVGPITRTVKDAALVLQEISGYDPLDLASIPTKSHDLRSSLETSLAGRRIAAPVTHVREKMNIDLETLQAYEQAVKIFQTLGAEVMEADLPDEFQYATDVVLIIGTAEAFAYHEDTSRTNLDQFGSGFASVPLQGALYTASDYIQAQRGRTLVCRMMADFMQSFDLFMWPTTSSPALGFEAEAQRPLWRRTTLLRRLFSLTGQPAISIPCGFSKNNLPIGLQLVGRWHEDHMVLSAAHAYERATDWHLRKPPLDQ